MKKILLALLIAFAAFAVLGCAINPEITWRGNWTVKIDGGTYELKAELKTNSDNNTFVFTSINNHPEVKGKTHTISGTFKVAGDDWLFYDTNGYSVFTGTHGEKTKTDYTDYGSYETTENEWLSLDKLYYPHPNVEGGVAYSDNKRENKVYNIDYNSDLK